MNGKRVKRKKLQIVSMLLALILFAGSGMTVYAEKSSEELIREKKEAEKEKKKTQKELNGVNSQINSITGAQATLGDEMELIDAEIVALLTDINLIEADIENKGKEIEETQAELEAAQEEERSQYEAMKIRARYLYEQGDVSYLSILLQSSGFSDALTKADYVEKLYEYDRKMLILYQETVEYTASVKAKLEEEKSELETSKIELEEEQAYLSEVLEEKQEEYENYDVLLAQAKQQAAAYTAQINQQTSQIKALEKQAAEQKKKEEEEARRKAEEEEARRRAAEETARESESSSSSYSSSSSGNGGGSSYTASGSGKGADIANFALQFVGNPYVAGGTSLTNGADCSGFVQSVYKNFGISLPRSSYAQATVGQAVSYDSARPGDVIYYGGHVGIYIGNGRIVHASTERTGIKISSATYRSIVTIRRII